MIHFTSDTHFGHANIIEYCKRPFKDPDEMTEQLILNWNKQVGPADDVYHLGDIYMGYDAARIDSIHERLNGNIHLVLGNHDKRALELAKRNPKAFVSIDPYLEIKVKLPNQQKYEVVLLHYAMRVWNGSHHGSLHAYGHSHDTLPEEPQFAHSMDIGVDSAARLLGGKKEDYRPFSFEEFRDRVLQQKWQPVDHHGRGVKSGE